jgi:hypothetical protein
MNWTDQKPPIKGESYYDHVKLETPIGWIIIEWKSWKESPSYEIMINDNWIGAEYSLDDAKLKAVEYIKDIYSKLEKFLNQ